MKLPSCWSCDYTFKWKELFFFIKRKKCSRCHKKQYITTKSNWRLGMTAIPLTIIVFILNSLSLNWVWDALVLIIALLIYSAIMPFLLEFTDKDQPLF